MAFLGERTEPARSRLRQLPKLDLLQLWLAPQRTRTRNLSMVIRIAGLSGLATVRDRLPYLPLPAAMQEGLHLSEVNSEQWR